MNYLKIYQNFIKKYKNRIIPKTEYHENHHIIPNSIFNDAVKNLEFNCFGITKKHSKNNLIDVFPKEHFIIHLLLVKIFRYNKNCYEKMLYAANVMSNRTKNSKEYSWLKKQFSLKMSEMLTGKPSRFKGKQWSEKRKKIGQPNLKGKTYEEIHGAEKAKLLKEIRKKSRIGKTHSKKTIDKLSNIIKTDEWKKKISLSKTGVPLTENHKNKIRQSLNNPFTNPHIDRTLYKFYHKDGREIISTKYDMKKNYGCHLIYKVIKGERNHNNGWQFKGEIVSV